MRCARKVRDRVFQWLENRVSIFPMIGKTGRGFSNDWKIVLAAGLLAATVSWAADVAPSNGPYAGGNVVLVTNAAPDIGNGSDITNVVLGGVGTTNLTGQGANWVAFVAPATGSAGLKNIMVQSVSAGDTTLAGAYTVNPAGVIPPEQHSGIQATITLSSAGLNGARGARGVILAGANADDFSGWSVDSAGDVNGDGLPDLLVGAAGADPSGVPSAGETYLIYGRSNGLPALITLTNTWFNGTNGVLLAGAQQGDESGCSVSSAGDVNGDGYSDILIGALTADPSGRGGAGETYLVYGRSNGLPALITLTNTWLDGTNGVLLAGTKSGGRCGKSVDSAGDVNGDGFSDMLVGADSYGGWPSAAGETYLVYGRSNGLPALITLTNTWLNGTNGIILAGAVINIVCGWSVSAAGDVNGDGFADILVGAPKAFPSGRDNAGEAYLVYGRSNGLPALVTLASTWLDGTNGVLLAGARAYSQLGLAVNSAGDMNGDGYDDILVGAGGENRSYLVYGRSNGLPALITLTNTWCDGTNGVTLAGARTGDACGSSLSAAGDVNGDGLPDFLVGADRASPGGRGSAGETYVVYGRSNALPALITMTNTWLDGTNGVLLAGALANDWSGCSVRSAGDANGDGYDDILIGASYADPSGRNIAGESYLVYGGELFDAVYVIPSSGPFAGGFQVTINGSNLCNGADITNVTLCGVAVTNIVSQSATQVVVWAGASDHVGPGDVRVFSTSFGETMQSNAFTYNGSGIQVSGPAFGPVAVGGKATNFFTVSNSGTEDLLITAATNNGPGAACFNVSALEGKTVSPGMASNFPVIFTAAAAGTVTATCYTVNNSPTSNYSFALCGKAYALSASNGPYAGGNTVTITNGYFGTITNVTVGGVAATIQDSGDSWVRIAVPAAGSVGVKDIVIQTSDNGDLTLAAVYTVNPAGRIGWTTDASAWTNLGGGMDGCLGVLACDETNLYAGGWFTTAGGQPASCIAQWDAAAGAWTNLGSGMDGAARALARDGTNLYAGGEFMTAGGETVSYIAKWDAATGAWTNLGGGMDSTVYALAWDGTNLYAGGSFTTAGGAPANFVAQWNPATESWANLGDGMNSEVRALAHDGTNLYAGGYFTTAGGAQANYVAKWDAASGAWTNLGAGMDSCVLALLHDGTNLYAGGGFSTSGGGPGNFVAIWDPATGAWTNLGAGMNSDVYALAHDGTNLYAGGNFTSAGGVTANRVAKWNPTSRSWTNLVAGMDSDVYALSYNGSHLYAGGCFTTAGGVSANYVAKWLPRIIDYSGVEPSSGAVNGGFRVTIAGANLGNGADITNVTLCDVSVTNIASQSATQVVVWAGSSGGTATGAVRVFSTSFGETEKSNAFTYESPSLVTLCDVALVLDNGHLQLCWRTTTETETLGFDLYREAAGAWVKVTAAMIAAQGWPNGGVGASYCVADPGARVDGTYRYQLVEYETTGGIQEYGPFERSVWTPRLHSVTASPAGIVLQWLSREGDTYDVFKARDARADYLPAVSGLPATPPVNAWTDQTDSAGAAFYRIEAK